MGGGGVWLIVAVALAAAVYLWYATIIARRNAIVQPRCSHEDTRCSSTREPLRPRMLHSQS